MTRFADVRECSVAECSVAAGGVAAVCAKASGAETAIIAAKAAVTVVLYMRFPSNGS
ncbi:MAG TPA: hypothetical protein VND95_06135 [Stellaceae bacterium]|nr:hypothetical protein [Stellaceae bacterium]